MKRVFFGILLLLMVAPVFADNATVTNLTRYAPFIETLVCSNVNDTYIINGIVNMSNITIGNQTYVVIVENNTPQLGLAYNVEFASSVSPNGSQINALFIHNHDGDIVQQRDWSFTPGETKSINLQLPFFCPADLTPQINLQTCSAFFDQYITKEQPVLFTLATGTRQCQEELSNRTADLRNCLDESRELDKDRVSLRDTNIDKEDEIKKLLDDLNEPDGACQARVIAQINQTNKCLEEKKGMVDGWWMWYAIALTIILLSIEIYRMTWGG